LSAILTKAKGAIQHTQNANAPFVWNLAPDSDNFSLNIIFHVYFD